MPSAQNSSFSTLQLAVANCQQQQQQQQQHHHHQQQQQQQQQQLPLLKAN